MEGAGELAAAAVKAAASPADTYERFVTQAKAVVAAAASATADEQDVAAPAAAARAEMHRA